MKPKTATIPIGVVVRRTSGASKWSRFFWRVAAVIPGAPNGGWREMRRDGDAVEFFAGTRNLTLYRGETEAYLTGLSVPDPKLYVILRYPSGADTPGPLDLVLVTASPYEAQDYTDNGEDIVEPVAMPDAVASWVAAFIKDHHHQEAFVKRKRDKLRVDKHQDGVGDPRVEQANNVYRAPGIRVAEGRS